MPSSVEVRPGLLGVPQPLYCLDINEFEPFYAQFSTGLCTKAQLKAFCNKNDCNFSLIEDSTNIEMWINDKIVGLSAISFTDFDDEDDEDSTVFVFTQDWVAIADEFRGKGIGTYMAEQCGYFAGSVAIQHMAINKVKECTFLFTADFISEGGEKYFFKMVQHLNDALDQGCRILKKKFILEAETDSLEYEYRSKGPRRK